ncbi:MAG TPA: hypothetical protein VKE70_06255 [Candidatus Solibacter sp.]|nr:hypothetical protein [Candidatus Solibacter sp.]
MVLVSDRALKVLWLIRPFHEVELAQAFYAEMLRPSLSRRESAGDYPWVSEGLSYQMAQRYREREYAENRSVQEWIELFNIFSIVDRFETEPKIPFVRTFFEREATVDPLHEQIGTYNNDLPPGHVILGKLHNRLGDPQFASIVDHCSGGNQPFRACAGSTSDTNLDGFFTQWVQPYPRINYDFTEVQFNERPPVVRPPFLPAEELAQGAAPSESLPEGQTEHVAEEAGFEHSVIVRRTASREIHEPVDVRLQSIGGQRVDLRWDGSGDQARLTVVTPGRMQQAIIDPDRTLIETTRADNAVPPIPQIVLDTAEVEVSSTEFGISGLVVARGRYDYRKDFAAAGIYTNRGIGGTFGGRYHWGEQNDPTSYSNNLYGFYSIAALNHSFKDKQHPTVRTTGHINGLGLRYDYNNVVNYDNPTHEVQVQLFVDWFDQALGSNFNFVDWGGDLVLTHPLWSYRTILAGEIFNGFSEPLGSGVVPLQGLFSLGGSRSIRGIGAEEELARNIFIVRGELRQSIYPELDLNLLDFLVLRRAQLRAFVDTGNVSNSAGAIYNPSGYAVGVGLGFGAVYEFMGFFPSLAYLEVATRVDEASQIGDVQVLFGTRQSF